MYFFIGSITRFTDLSYFRITKYDLQVIVSVSDSS